MANNQSNRGSKKKQYIIFGLCSLIALALCMITLVIVVNKVEENAVKEGTASAVDYQKLAAEKGEPKEYLFDLTEKTLNNKLVKVDLYTDVSIDDSSIVINGSADGSDASLFKFFKNKLLPDVDSYYREDFKGEFGFVCDNMPLIDLLSTENLQVDSSVGLKNENGEPVLDDNGSLVDEEYYYLSFGVNGADIKDKKSEASYGLLNKPDVEKLIKKDLADLCNISSISVSEDVFEIEAKVSLSDDKIVYIEIQRLYKIKAEMCFVNKLSSFGEKEVEFDYKVTERYEYSYAGVELSPEELYLDKGEESLLAVNAVIEDDSEYVVGFSSSDETVATVDEMGYVKAVSERDEPVIITVTLEYLGETFTDECAVYVGADNEEVLI